MTIRCGKCRWWGLKPDYLDDDDHYDPTNQIPGGDNHKVCGHPKVGSGGYNDEKRKSIDSVNSYSSIGTGADFGCIHGDSI